MSKRPDLSIAHLAEKQQYKHYCLFHTVKNKVELNRELTLEFLKNRGYFIFRITVEKFQFIRIVKNIVKIVGEKDIVDEVKQFVKNDEENSIFYEHFLTNVGKYLSDSFLMLLESRKVDIKRDVKDAMQLYFANCIVKVTKDSIKTFDYSELNGYIWESQIIQRDFSHIEYENLDANFDYSVFVANICKRSPDRVLALCTSIGYMLHNYKNDAKAPAIVLNDEVMTDEPEGGSGKGLIGKSIAKFCSTVVIEGKTFSFEKGFLYSRINADTRIMFFEDVKKNFDFERLFSVMTDGITTEKKGLNETYLDFDETPKVLISTNYAIRGTSSSFKRRKHDIEIHNYYSDKLTPYDEFGKLFFKEWSKEEWNQYDNYIINCCQLYLTHGLYCIDTVNVAEKRLISETGIEFVEFMDDYVLDGAIIKQKLLDDFIFRNPKYGTPKYSWLDRRKFQAWVKAYCDVKEIIVVLDGFNNDKTTRCFIFKQNEIF